MKKFISKLLFRDAPGKGAFWSLVLLILGSWLLLSFGLLSGGMFYVIQAWNMLEIPPSGPLAHGIAILSTFLLLFIYFIVLQVHFWVTLRKEQWTAQVKKAFYGMILCWGSAFGVTIYCIKLFLNNIFADDLIFSYLAGSAHLLPFYMTAAVIWILSGIIGSGAFYSLAGNYPARENFTLPVKILAGISLALYIGFIVAALLVHKRYEAEKATLAKQFGHPFTIEEIQKMSLGTRKVDKDFWQEIETIRNHNLDRELNYPFAEYSPQQLDNWQKKFSTSPDYAKLDRLTAQKIPAFPHKLEKYYLIGTLLPDYSATPTMFRVQAWKIRFALARRDRAAIMEAFKKIDNITDYISDQIFLIGIIIKIRLEEKRLYLIENILAEQILNKDDLLYLKQRSRAVAKALDNQERIAFWSDVYGGIDFIEGFLHRRRSDGDSIPVTPWERFKFLFPQMWLVHEINSLNYVNAYLGKREIADVLFDTPDYFDYYSLIKPAYQSTWRKIRHHKCLQRGIEFFIDQELYRLEHGKLADDLPRPVDPVSGKPMEYFYGDTEITREVFQPNKNQLDKKDATVRGRKLMVPATKHFDERNYVIIPDRRII